MSSILIRNVRILDPVNGMDTVGEIFIRDGSFAPVTAPDADTQIIDGTGLTAAPGLIDLHVHLRDPGQTDKEDILSGCRAAAAGGVTQLLAMPNTKPSVDTPEIVRYIAEKAKNADARVHIVGAITKGLGGHEATDIAALRQAGISALSDDGVPVLDTSIMVAAMQKAAQTDINIPVTAHCEDPYLAGGKVNEGAVSRALGVKGMPCAAEDAGTARELALAESYGLPIHICHVSTATSAAMIRDAKKRGVRVTAETAPHYLMLTEEALLQRDADYRMNPPLRTERDRLAMIEALKDGTIDAIATDHAPHTPQEKADFVQAPNGSIGMETSFAAAYTVLVKGGILREAELIRKMSVNPAHILKTYGGTLSVGAPADLMLYRAEEWTVDPEKLHGKSKNTPFKGLTLAAKVKLTIYQGRIVFNELYYK
ncbi:MAG: dihydroorotase [Clostridia bacterium]|nr:dihydroorotase [Clostridia bacterium]